MPNAKMDMLTDNDLAYLAGIVDGEGCIRVARHSTYPHRFNCILTVTNTNPVLMDWLKQTFGGNISTHQPSNSNHKISYVWTISGSNSVKLVKIVKPFLKLKVEQASLLLSFWAIHESWNVRTGAPTFWGYTEQAAAVAEAMRILNKKGAVEDAKL